MFIMHFILYEVNNEYHLFYYILYIAIRRQNLPARENIKIFLVLVNTISRSSMQLCTSSRRKIQRTGQRNQ